MEIYDENIVINELNVWIQAHKRGKCNGAYVYGDVDDGLAIAIRTNIRKIEYLLKFAETFSLNEFFFEECGRPWCTFHSERQN